MSQRRGQTVRVFVLGALGLAVTSGCTPLVEGRLDHDKHPIESSDAGDGDASHPTHSQHDAGGMHHHSLDAGPQALDAGDAQVAVEPDAGPPDHHDGGITDSGSPTPIACVESRAFAPSPCPASPPACSEPNSCPSHNAWYCKPYCASSSDCAESHPLTACAHDSPTRPSSEVEFQIANGAPLPGGDMSVHFSTLFDETASRGKKLVLSGGGLEIALEHDGWSLWSLDTARVFAADCESKAMGAGRCSAPFVTQDWITCYERCAETRSYLVWSYEPTPGADGYCRCSEVAGEAHTGVLNARSGRLRDATATPVEANAGASVDGMARWRGDELQRIDAVTLDSCASSCEASASEGNTPRCLAYVFGNPGADGNGTCYLKGNRKGLALSYPTQRSATGLTEPGVLIERALANQVNNNFDRPGGDYQNLAVSRWDECADRCALDAKCLSWNFSKADNVQNNCWLKSGATTPQFSAYTISAAQPSILVTVTHAFAGGSETVRLRARRHGYFAGSFTIVRDATAHTYQLYVDGQAGDPSPYQHDPVPTAALLSATKVVDGVPSSEDHAPVSDLLFFDTQLSSADVTALLVKSPPVHGSAQK